jgi:hypothetical protein
MLAKIRPHCLQHLRQHGRGGVIVEINPAHMDILRRAAVAPSRPTSLVISKSRPSRPP